MSDVKHTPGPRRAVRANGEHGFVLGPDGETVVGRFAQYADAILDAAAPDLLEALTELLKHAGIADADPSDIDGEDHARESNARAAIAKATA